MIANATQDQIVAWALQRASGGRGFGTSMSHYFKNWQQEDFRKMILNALVWTAQGRVPQEGVESHLIQDEVSNLLATP